MRKYLGKGRCNWDQFFYISCWPNIVILKLTNYQIRNEFLTKNYQYRQAQWILNLGWTSNQINIKNSRVCHLHFPPSQLRIVRKVIQGGVPSLISASDANEANEPTNDPSEYNCWISKSSFVIVVYSLDPECGKSVGVQADLPSSIITVAQSNNYFQGSGFWKPCKLVVLVQGLTIIVTLKKP